MFYMCGSFDYRSHKPHMIASFDGHKVEFYQLFAPNTKSKLGDIVGNATKINKLLGENEVVLDGFKQFLVGLNTDLTKKYNVYDLCNNKIFEASDINKVKLDLTKYLISIKDVKPKLWNKLFADSQIVYRHLELKGYYLNGKLTYPKYEVTYSGRSKCSNGNIHGASDDDSVHPYDYLDEYYVHFDWIAADLRMASIMSGDKILRDSYINSDPYSTLQKLNKSSRDDCKQQLFSSLYSLNPDGISEYFPQLAEWMKSEIIKIDNNNYGESILGKEFKLDELDCRTIRSAFNAQIQGSVAHGMQNVLYKIYNLFPHKILTEIHDSLILTCCKDELKSIIDSVSNIMLRPFDGILDDDHIFPLKVSVGKKWRNWSFYKEYR